MRIISHMHVWSDAKLLRHSFELQIFIATHGSNGPVYHAR
jgi:hypothetical protein